MKKIVFIIDHLKGGGAELMVLNLAAYLYKKGVEINILALDGTNNYIEETKCFNFIDMSFPNTWLSGKLLIDKPTPTTSISKMNEVIKKIAPDCIIVTIWYSFMVLPYIEHENIWAWSQADILPDFSRTNNPIKNIRNKYKDKIFNRKFKEVFNDKNIITVNNELKLKYLSILDTKNVITITNGLDLPFKSSDVLQNKKWDVIFVGRLSPTKQIDHAIKAFKVSKLEGKMLIVGEGPQLKKLKKLVENFKLQHQVVFKGWVEMHEIPNLIKESRVLVLPSRTEGYPLVIGESLTVGTPVVAYNCSEGISSQLYTEDMKRGLVQTNDIKALSLTLISILNQPYEIPIDIRSKYDLNEMTNKFISVIS